MSIINQLNSGEGDTDVMQAMMLGLRVPAEQKDAHLALFAIIANWQDSDEDQEALTEWQASQTWLPEAF